MTIEEVMAEQVRLNSLHIHIVWIGSEKFSVAHTEWEREEGFEVMQDCELVDWLADFPGPPVPTGLYAAVEDDQESWELIPVDSNVGG